MSAACVDRRFALQILCRRALLLDNGDALGHSTKDELMAKKSGVALGGTCLLGVGLYSVSESAAVIRHRVQKETTNRRLLRWAHSRTELAKFKPIIGPPLLVEGEYLFTFAQLMELMTVAALRAKGVTVKAIRRAHERGREKYGNHPFAREGYRTDGIGIFTEEGSEEAEELSRQQLFFEEVIHPILADVSYVDSLAAQFSPLGNERSVILDPRVAFGSPVDKETGVPTATLFAMSNSGESDEAVADWYGVSVTSVRDAIEYETALRKAA